MPLMTYLDAIRQGIWEEMERDPSVFFLGEDIGVYGGAFKVTAGMQFLAASSVVPAPAKGSSTAPSEYRFTSQATCSNRRGLGWGRSG